MNLLFLFLFGNILFPLIFGDTTTSNNNSTYDNNGNNNNDTNDNEMERRLEGVISANNIEIYSFTKQNKTSSKLIFHENLENNQLQISVKYFQTNATTTVKDKIGIRFKEIIIYNENSSQLGYQPGVDFIESSINFQNIQWNNFQCNQYNNTYYECTTELR